MIILSKSPRVEANTKCSTAGLGDEFTLSRCFTLTITDVQRPLMVLREDLTILSPGPVS
jgi:hypothetical protein